MTFPKNKLASLLRAEGISKTSATLSDAEGWAIVDRAYANAKTSGQRNKGERQYIDEWGEVHDYDWVGLQNHLDAFSNWFNQKSFALQKAMYAWQDTPEGRTISPSDDSMGDLARNTVMMGRSVYDSALRDPGILPRTYYGYKGEIPLLLKFNNSYGYAFQKWHGSGARPPNKRWVVDLLAGGRGWADFTPSQRKEYLKENLGIAKFARQRVPMQPPVRSDFWEFIWYPQWDYHWKGRKGYGQEITDAGLTIPLTSEVVWGGFKSLKKGDLLKVLADTEKTFRPWKLRMDSDAGFGFTLEEVAKENLRKKNPHPRKKPVSLPNKAKKYLEIPLTGDVQKDKAALVAAFSKALRP